MGFGPVPASFTGVEPATQDDRDVSEFQDYKSSSAELLGYGIPLTLAGAIDEVGQSVGLLEEGEIKDAITAISTDAGRVYGQNEEGFKTAGAIATTLVPILAVPKILRAGKLLDKVLTKTKIGTAVSKALITSGKQHQDRIRSLGKELSVMKDAGSIDVKQMPQLLAAIKKEKLGAMADSLRENVAIDTAIYGLLNESDVLFPSDSPYTNLALYTVPTALMAAGSYAFTGRAIMRHIAAVDGFAGELQKARSVKGLNTSEVLTVKGNRGVDVADASEQFKQAQVNKTEAVSQQGKDNGLAAEKVQEQRMQSGVHKLSEDSIYPAGIGGKFNFKPDSGENLTAVNMYKTEPSMAVGAMELVPLTKNTEIDLLKNQTRVIENLEKDTGVLQRKLDKLESGSPEKIKLQEQMDELQVNKQLNKDMTAEVLETDGSVVPVAEKRYTVLDQPESLTYRSLKEGVELSSADAHKLGQEIGVSKSGALIIGNTGQQSLKNQTDEIIHGINATSVIPKQDLTNESLKFSSAAMEDVVVDYTTLTKTGRELFESLDEDILVKLNTKHGFSDMTEDQITRMQGSFEKTGLAARLRNDVADADGMVPLYTQVKDPLKSFNKLTKFSIKPIPSEGTEVIRKMVFVDDIVGIHQGGVLVKPLDNTEIINGKISKLRLDEKERLFTSQNIDQRTTSYAVAQKFVDDFNPEEGTKLIANEGRTHLELDMQVAVLKKFPDADTVNFAPNPSLKGQELIDALEYLSIVKKAKEYSKLTQAHNANKRGLLNIAEGALQNAYTKATTLNLPNPTGFGNHPIVDLLDALTPSVGNVIPSLRNIGKNLQEVKQQMGAMVKEGGELREGISLSGNSLRFDKNAKMKPVVQLSQSRAKNRVAPDALNGLIQAAQINRYSMLDKAEEYGANMVKIVWDSVLENPALFAAAKKVDFITEGTQAGKGTITSAAFANRNSETIKAMDTIQDIVGRKAVQHIADVFRPHNLNFSRLASHGNEGSLISYNQTVNELQNGWDVLEAPMRLAEGKKFGLALDADSQRNVDMYKQFFGRDLKADTEASVEGLIAMPVRASTKEGDGIVPKPAVMDQGAFDALNSTTQLSHQYLDNVNHLRRTKNLTPINKRNWHVPFYDLRGEHILHITDMEGRTINMVSGSTAGEALRIANERVKAFGDNNIRSTIQTQDFTERHVVNAGGQFEAPTTNFGLSGTQTGRSKGLTASPQQNIGIDTMQQRIKQLQNNFNSITRYTNTAIFEGELNYAARTAKALPASSDVAKKAGNTQLDEYARVTMQTAGLSEKTGVGKLSYGIESAADMALAKLWDKYHDFIPSSTSASKREFDKFNDAVGGAEYNPFNTFNEFLERTTKVKVPPKLRGINSKMANFTTAMVLRIFDAGMPLLNFASVGAVAPAVIRALQRVDGESIAAHQSRIGIMGTAMENGTAIPSTGRMLSTGLHGMFDPETRAAIKIMKEQGMFKQEVAEKIELITSPIQGYMGRMTDKTVEWLSKPTDWSETMSRQISFSMFYQIGRKSMQLDEGAARTFAQKLANDVVGDYRASNRPQIFQASGMPFGAFTTWSWNFMQRVYGDLEGGRLGAVAMQAATHAFLFGTESLPGYESATELMSRSYDGKTNLADNLDNAFGPEAMDIVGAGALGQIPKLFGGDAINIGSRASVGLPSIITANSLADMVPSIKVARDLMRGGVETVNSIRQNSGINGRELAEVWSNYGVNGALKGGLQGMLGYKVDKAGQLVNSDTRRLSDMIGLGFELKTVSENNKRKEVRRDRLMQEQKAQRANALNKQLRSFARDPNGIPDEAFEGIVQEAHKQGMTMDSLKNSMKSAAIIGQVEITDRNLVQALRKNLDAGRTARLMRFQEDDAIE